MGSSRFYGLLTALLFAAVCAYAGAAVFSALQPGTDPILPTLAKSGGGELRGIILRHEQAAPENLSAKAGERIPAGEGLSASALFMPISDGYEHLSPEISDALTLEKLDALMHAEPKPTGGARLIYGFDCYFAAFFKGDFDIEPGSCRLRFEDEEEIRRAEILSVSPSDTGCVLLLRLMLDEALLERRFCSAELIPG